MTILKYDKWLTDYKSKFANEEVVSFEDKRKEALAWNIDNTTSTPVCDAIAAGAGIDREAYLQSVIDKVAVENNYLMIFDVSAGSVSYAKPNLDITDLVLEELENYTE